MKFRKKTATLLIAIFMISSVVSISGAFGNKPGGTKETLQAVIVEGADYHLGLQDTYSGIEYTWEWIVGSQTTGPNVQGISATGLLAAYEKTKDVGYLSAALNSGDVMVDHYENNPTGRPYSQDVEFLVRLSKDSKDNSYDDVAVLWYDNTITGYTDPADLADYYINARLSLAGWDLASQIRATAATGNLQYAKGIADRLIERSEDWEGILLGGYDYTISSYGSLLWALHILDDPSYDDEIAFYRESLISTQEEDGSWDVGDYQSTAYVSLGLSAVNGKGAKDAVSKAFQFLYANQADTGGWSYPPEYGEVNSEVLMALSAMKLADGLQLGKTDPQPEHGNDLGKHPLDPIA
ncbi:hypothetical protein ES703_20203 [subsurface metagenome]